MNWTGLLNWSLSYSDGTRPSEVKPMDEETKKWLKEALESFCVDETTVLKKATDCLSAAEEGNDEERELKEAILYDLLGVIENLEAARNLVKVGGIPHLVRCMAGSRYLSVRKLCASVFSSAVQNNPAVQEAAMNAQALDALLELVQVESDQGLQEQYFSCLSALVRGEYTLARQKFIEKDGLLLAQRVIRGTESMKITKKIVLLLSDIFHQCKLNKEVETINLANHLGMSQDIGQLMDRNDEELTEMAAWAINNLIEANEDTH
ncbi:unnamed protein product [Blepharisma stoltei]|uniref:Nucleotide exchange factor Fes1 domain-containing protein n=1 Tax=Blepharisma stoltei TaxID=1481888 RepID=A0AAU9JT31_9CILI|nr:unnamed protein product [Blepharisma stoltei]